MNSKIIECFDIGGTQTRGALISDGKIVGKTIKQQSVHGDTGGLIDHIANISSQLRAGLNGESVAVTVLGVPGPVDKGVLLSSPPLGFNDPVELENSLSEKLRSKVFVKNDLNLAAHAELNIGHGKTFDNFCLLTISTGIGVGVVINREVIDRKTEAGHLVIEAGADARPCIGHSGCWAAHASGSFVSKYIDEIQCKGDVGSFFESSSFVKMRDKIRNYNAQGIGNIVNVYDPELVIVMGSFGVHQFEKIIPSPSEVEMYTINRPIPKIVKTQLGDDTGLLGAFYYGVSASND